MTTATLKERGRGGVLSSILEQEFYTIEEGSLNLAQGGWGGGGQGWVWGGGGGGGCRGWGLGGGGLCRDVWGRKYWLSLERKRYTMGPTGYANVNRVAGEMSGRTENSKSVEGEHTFI